VSVSDTLVACTLECISKTNSLVAIYSSLGHVQLESF
jgi:hypothetical protein